MSAVYKIKNKKTTKPPVPRLDEEQAAKKLPLT